MIGFLAGFLSQSRPGEACIHAVGVHPGEPGHGHGRWVCETFLAAARARGATPVRAVTAPVNRRSVAFHRRLGFGLEPGDTEAAGIPVTANSDGQGHRRVRFLKHLTGTTRGPAPAREE